jgi:hypothetical protein
MATLRFPAVSFPLFIPQGNAQALSSSSSSCSSQGQPDAFMSFNPAASTLDFTPHAPLGAGHLSLAAMRQVSDKCILANRLRVNVFTSVNAA